MKYPAQDIVLQNAPPVNPNLTQEQIMNQVNQYAEPYNFDEDDTVTAVSTP